MVEILSFVAAVVVVSLSGVLMPGPVTAVTVAQGSHNPHAGAWVAIGHAVVEVPIIALLYFGAGAVFQLLPVKVGLGFLGSLVLLWMGAGMLLNFNQAELKDAGSEARSPFVAGMALSLANPYFFLWWAIMGAVLVQKSFAFGVYGFILLVAVHWSCDLGWYYFLSVLSFSGSRFFGRRLQQVIFIICGLFLLYFAGYFASAAAFSLVI